MDDMTRFEQRFEDRVQTFALTGIRPVDSAAVAHAVAVGQPRDRGTRSAVRWHGLRLDHRAWTIAVALGLLAAMLGGALLVGARLLAPPSLDASRPANGWIAFTVAQEDPAGGSDTDIWFSALDQEARRVVGSDTDNVDELCPAFSPDGRSLAYGRVEGHGTDYFMNADGTEGSLSADYREAALVVADVRDDGQVSDRLTIGVGDALPPPCPVWSPDGERVAFGVPQTSPINPETSAAGSEVWVVTLADPGTTVVPDLLATDLEWSPDGSTLAIASGGDGRVDGNALRDGRIHLYAPASGAMRTLDETLGAIELTWSPDGRYIVYTGVGGGGDDHRELRVIDLETERQRTLAARFGVLHGIGPVWSPDGHTIAFQRGGFGGEHSEVVLMTPGDLSAESAPPRETVVPVTARGSSERLDPYRVTWSPDGQYLLMMAWGAPPDAPGTREDPLLVASPVDPAMPTVVLSRIDGLVPYDGYPDTTLVPIQTWARSPSD
jgi:Tol biopolymer transport system component